jgi:hypothetical protein
MSNRKRKMTATEKAAKRRRREEYMMVFVGGKQKRVRRPPTIDGVDVDEFIRRNADPIWLHENEMWERMDMPDQPGREDAVQKSASRESRGGAGPHDDKEDDDIPF